MLTTVALLATVATTTTDPPAGDGALAPRLTADGDGVLLSWIEPAEAGYRLRFSRFGDDAWSPPRTIHAGGGFFANWADVPSVIRVEGVMLASWLQKSGPATYAYDVRLARSTDDGVTWTALGPAHDDGTQTEHGFVSMVPEAGSVRLFWLDGRAMADPEPGPMTIRTRVIGDTRSPEEILDDRICECCNTSAVVTADGPLIAYRDRGDDETRDISVVRRVDGKWTKPEAIAHDGWRIASCPVNGPALAARGKRVAAAWFTGAIGDGGSVRVAISSDSGATFGQPITIDDTFPMGRVDLVLEPSGDAIVCWLDTDGPNGAIRVRRVRTDGSMGQPMTLVETSLSRGTGFPQMAIVGDGLMLVWTDDGRPQRLRGRTYDLPE